MNPWSRPGTPLEKIDGVVIHYVGNPATTAQANRNYFASLADEAEGTYASSHFLVGLEGEVIQCVPLTEIAYASNIRNEDTVAIEVCHPDETGHFSDVTYARAVELTAWLCRTFRPGPGDGRDPPLRRDRQDLSQVLRGAPGGLGGLPGGHGGGDGPPGGGGAVTGRRKKP